MPQRKNETTEHYIERLERAIERAEANGRDTEDLQEELDQAEADTGEDGLTDEQESELSDFIDDFPELEYLDDLEDLTDDEDFYTPES